MNKDKLFNNLVSEVRACKKCDRMINREEVLGTQCGDIYSKILFIGEAPGRLGANLTKLPFSGDKTGDNFEEFSKHIGWNRDSFFITNTVLCNPQDKNGNNDKPKDSEIKFCSSFLKETIEIINPKLIVTLGGKSLKGLSYIQKHDITLKNDVASPKKWGKYIVFPLYHCSPKAFMSRNKVIQFKDYERLLNYSISIKP